MSCKERPGEYSRLPRETVVQPRVDKGLNYRRATEKGGDGVGIFETGSAERGDCWDVGRGSQKPSEGQSCHHCVLEP